MGYRTQRLARRGRRGIVLIAVCVCLLLMLAGLGLGVDLNRFVAARAALASRVEAGALGAVLELDGTEAGLERARVRAAAGYRTAALVEFAVTAAGPWKADPLNFAEVRAARVSASGEMPLSLLRGIVARSSLPLRVAMRAEQRPVDRIAEGLLPWAISESVEPGQAVALPESLTAEPDEPRHGGAGRLIRAGLAEPVGTGDTLGSFADPTPQASRESLRRLAASDTNPDAPTYAAYADSGRGNGRRLVLLPLVDSRRVVKGFSAFLVVVAPSGGEVRLERVGSFLQGSRHQAVAQTGVWRAEAVTE